jgi:probable F420-dependent oxidoreductase
MDIGLVLQTNPPASEVIELAKRAEDAGFSHVWTFDSCVLWQEPFVIYSQILAQTDSIKVGPMVTNPLTRAWEVTASLFATLNEMYGNRTVCGIGRGDSAVRVKGGKPATLATLSEAMRIIKALAEGRGVEIDGTEVRIPWVENGELEMWMGAYGPKALELAGREADGLILQLADPFIVEWAGGTAYEWVEASGRDVSDFSLCVAAPAYVGNDIAHQRDQVRWFGGMVGNHVADIVARYGEDAHLVPQALTAYIAGRQEYDYSHHGKAGNPSTDFVPDDIVDRFCLLGPVEAHCERLSELEQLGVDQFAVYLMHDDPIGTIEAYGKSVIGQF